MKEDAVRIFEGPTLEQVDDQLDYGEIRVYAIGVVNGIEITVIYADISETSAALFRPGVQSDMKEKLTGKVSTKDGTDRERLRSLSDKDIRTALEADPEARPTDANFWKRAKVVLPQPKQTVTIRLDADLLGWLRSQKGYQTRINAVLRTWMEAQKS